VAGTDDTVAATSPDQIAVAAVLTGGATASVHVHDAKTTAARTRIEIAGTDGDLALVSPGPGAAAGVQIGALALRGSRGHGSPREDLPVPDEYLWVPEAARDVEVLNVAQFYARLADDLRTGGRTVPGFDTGLHVHRLLDAVRTSAETGTRQEVARP
jgi:predicted dehydrogenase